MPSNHFQYMQRCLQLAKLGLGSTESNPMVGAVLVYEGQIIGEGFHAKYGEAHAEINCIKSVPKKLEHLIPLASMYVSLEPCNHTGKTPPCSHALVEAGIKKVFIATPDSNPLVASKGITYLKENGVSVEIGFCERAAYQLNKVFFTNQKEKRAFIKLKWAASADDFIGKENQQIAISNKASNILNHKYRTETDAILIGYKTALVDQPKLNARHWLGKQPIRIILDWDCALPTEKLTSTDQRTLILNAKKTENTNGLEYIQLEQKASTIAEVLYNLDICSVLVEGGATTHSFFMNENCWDEAIRIKSDLLLKEGIAAASISSKKLIGERQLANDIIYHYSNSEFIL